MPFWILLNFLFVTCAELINFRFLNKQTKNFAGENVVLRASYTLDGARRVKDIEKYTSLLPFFGTDYGLCTLIKPQITFDKDLEEIPFNELMRNYTKSIKPGIQLGKENGLSILLDAEVLFYFFSLINADQCFSYVMNCDDIIRLLPDLDHI